MAVFKIISLAVVLCALNTNAQSQKIVPMLLVHGGAGDVPDDAVAIKKAGIKIAARTGYATLISSGKALDAVEAAVRNMEENPNFNAGLGGVLTWDGNVETDAAIMDGSTLDAGCVSLVTDILHPITLARSIMLNTPHKYLAGQGAMNYAKQAGFDILEPGSLVTENAKKGLENYKNSLNASSISRPFEEDFVFGSPGTVGAVAIDADGNVAAATSTGGMMGKWTGRIGDSPILGGGTYADNDVGCVSATGDGESIMRYNVASRILGLIQYSNMTAQDATAQILTEMSNRFQRTAGVISIDYKGNFGIHFTSKRMSWAYQRESELHFGINHDEDIVEIVGEPRV